MRTAKCIWMPVITLIVATFVAAGSAVATEKEPTAATKRFQFHYGPFKPGADLMAPAPEGGIVYTDKAAKGVPRAVFPANGVMNTFLKTKP